MRATSGYSRDPERAARIERKRQDKRKHAPHKLERDKFVYSRKAKHAEAPA